MKHILLIFGLLWALGASGQGIYIDSYRFGAAPSATLLLDDYPNAAAAYSLRKLRTAYTGNCIVVRRSSNNDTLAIGFSGNYLDTAALKTFCTSTDCFVRRWYDQSGGGWDVVQNTDANQPTIVVGGVVNRADGIPAVRFNATQAAATDDWMRSATLGNYSSVITTFALFNVTALNDYVYDQGNDRYVLYASSNTMRIYVSADLNDGTQVINTRYLTYALYNTTSSAFTVNTTTYTGSTGAFNTANTITLGATFTLLSSFMMDGNFWEFVTYRSNQSANQANIRANINSFYNVY